MDTRDFLIEARQAVDAGQRVEMSVRDLLAVWGEKKRTQEVVRRVRAALKRAHLKCSPDFATVPLSTIVSIVDHRAPTAQTRSAKKTKSPQARARDKRNRLLAKAEQALVSAGAVPAAEDNEALKVQGHTLTSVWALGSRKITVGVLDSLSESLHLGIGFPDELPDDPRLFRALALRKPAFLSSASMWQGELGFVGLDVVWFLPPEFFPDVPAAVRDALQASHRLYDELRDSSEFAEVTVVGTPAAVAHDEPRPVDAILSDFSKLVGVDEVRQQVEDMVAAAQVHAARLAAGLPSPGYAPHLVFTGNPGTGKTTVARLIAELYRALGVLPSGHLVEVSRADLVAEHIGGTEQRTLDRIEQAKGGVLFIDEAYALAGRGHKDFGVHVIDTLLVEMENRRGTFAVVVAGYAQEISTFLASNPGLQSRFDHTLHFRDFDTEELVEIFHRRATSEGYRLDPGVLDAVRSGLEQVDRANNFSNGRFVRRMFDRTRINQQRRLTSGGTLDAESLQRLTADDVASAADLQQAPTRRPVGFR